jgi:hypothetical protein
MTFFSGVNCMNDKHGNPVEVCATVRVQLTVREATVIGKVAKIIDHANADKTIAVVECESTGYLFVRGKQVEVVVPVIPTKE